MFGISIRVCVGKKANQWLVTVETMLRKDHIGASFQKNTIYSCYTL